MERKYPFCGAHKLSYSNANPPNLVQLKTVDRKSSPKNKVLSTKKHPSVCNVHSFSVSVTNQERQDTKFFGVCTEG